MSEYNEREARKLLKELRKWIALSYKLEKTKGKKAVRERVKNTILSLGTVISYLHEQGFGFTDEDRESIRAFRLKVS